MLFIIQNLYLVTTIIPISETIKNTSYKYVSWVKIEPRTRDTKSTTNNNFKIIKCVFYNFNLTFV